MPLTLWPCENSDHVNRKKKIEKKRKKKVNIKKRHKEKLFMAVHMGHKNSLSKKKKLYIMG